MATTGEAAGPAVPGEDESRRDFLYIATGAFGVVGAALAIWPLIDSMNPSAEVRALSSVEVDLSGIELGQRVTIKWQGKPVFIDRRTPERIALAEDVDMDELPDPETDSARVQNPEWLIVVGICTHLGCVPKGQGMTQPRGDWGGWFCPCHGSHYDTSGRIRKGPAPLNLIVPVYELLDDGKVKIGEEVEV